MTASSIVLVLSPAVFNPFGYDEYQLPRLIVQAIAVILGFLAMVVTLGLPDRRALIPLAVLLAVLSLGALFSEAPLVSLVGTSSRRFGLFAWLVLAGAFVLGRAMSTTERRTMLTTALIASSALIAFYAILQRLGWDPFSADGAGPALRPTSTLGGATYLGGYLALALTLAVARWADETRALWLAPIVMIDVVALLLTQSRGGWIGGFVGVAIALAWVGSTRANLRSLVIGAVIAVVALVVAVALIPGLSSRVNSLAHPTRGTAGARFELSEIGIAAVLDRPIVGWGPDMSRSAIHDHLSSSFEGDHGDARIEDRAHNLIVDVAIWAGIVGLAAFIWFIVSIGRAAWAGRNDRSVVVIALGVLAYGIHLMFNFPVPDLDVVIWLLAGSLASWRPVVAHNRATHRLPSYIAVPVAALALALVMARAADELAADRSLRVAVDRENAGDVTAAGRAYESAQRSASGDALYDEVLTRYYLRVNQPQSAADAAARGVDADPSDPYMIELRAHSLDAVALRDSGSQSGMAAAAEDLLHDLISRAPNDGSLHLELGTALAIQGQTVAAEAAFARAVQLIPNRCEPYRNLALMQELRGLRVEAHLNFQKALFCMPDDSVAAAGVARTAPAH